MYTCTVIHAERCLSYHKAPLELVAHHKRRLTCELAAGRRAEERRRQAGAGPGRRRRRGRGQRRRRGVPAAAASCRVHAEERRRSTRLVVVAVQQAASYGDLVPRLPVLHDGSVHQRDQAFHCNGDRELCYFAELELEQEVSLTQGCYKRGGPPSSLVPHEASSYLLLFTYNARRIRLTKSTGWIDFSSGIR